MNNVNYKEVRNFDILSTYIISDNGNVDFPQDTKNDRIRI